MRTRSPRAVGAIGTPASGSGSAHSQQGVATLLVATFLRVYATGRREAQARITATFRPAEVLRFSTWGTLGDRRLPRAPIGDRGSSKRRSLAQMARGRWARVR